MAGFKTAPDRVFQKLLATAIIWLWILVNAVNGRRSIDPWPSESFLESSSVAALTFTPFTPQKKVNKMIETSVDSPSKDLNTMTTPSTFRFGNSNGQFVKMPAWVPKRSTSTFTFQFRTSLSNGLLLYLDDGGPRDYIELSVHARALRLRFKFGNARSVKITVGKNLDNRRWHSVVMEVRFPQVTLTVDGEMAVGAADGFDASPIVASSFTYLGGIPYLYKLQDLSLPSVYFETPFQGAIRRYAINGKYQRPLEKLKVIEEVGSDLCYTELNPCKNNGTCYVLNNQPACDCSGTRFSGKNCENPYDQAAATFLGAQWLAYDMPANGISSYSDSITLAFKTKQSDGLILHTGKSADYVNLALKQGGISLVVNLGSGALEVMLDPVQGTFNDNNWHYLKVHRELKQVEGKFEGASVNLTVDQAHTSAGFTQEDHTQLTLDDVFYIGGSPTSINLPGLPEANNFIGCLKEVTYRNNDGTVLQLSRMANNRDPLIRVEGIVENICADVDVYGPVTFLTSDSFVRMKPWINSRMGQLKLEFRTSEPHGLLLFGSGMRTDDFIAVEIYNGYLYLLINLGSGLTKLKHGSPATLNDGEWHRLSMKRDSRRLTFTVDNQETRMDLKGSSTSLDLQGSLYLGGADFEVLAKSPRLPKGLWTASLRYGFVGCVGDIYIDGIGIDIQALAKAQASDPVVVAPECDNLGRSACAAQPCRNSGKCREGWNRFVCDCSSTSFRGKRCELAVTTAGFNGSQTLQIPMANTRRTQAEEINFRFMTPLSTGLLLTTTSKTTTDRLTVQLVKGGQVKLTVDIAKYRSLARTRDFFSSPRNGGMSCAERWGLRSEPGQGPDSIFQGAGLNDNQWHTVKISRHGRRLSLEVDGKIRGTFGGFTLALRRRLQMGELPSGHNELQFDTVYMGQVSGPVSPRLKSNIAPPYGGQVQNLMFNNEPLIDKCFQRKLNCKFNGSWGESKIISNPVTFKDKDSYVAISTLDAYSSMTLFFNLRTTVSDGLILYNAGKDNDFIAVELVSGFVHYVYNLGNGAQIISTPDQSRINDNKWHDIRIVRDASNTHTLTVDGSKVTHRGIEFRRNLDLEGPLFVGGVRQDIYFTGLPDKVASRSGFQGCLGTFDFNGVSPQFLGKDMIQSAGTVSLGCSGPTSSCSNTSCANGGVCQQQWDSFTCDCSMTTFIGKTCQYHVSKMAGGTAYRFGGEGMIVYSWPSASFPSSREDTLALGFSTRVRNCVVTRISSTLGSNIRDYMLLEIENGKLTLRFNIGNDDVILREPMGVADGQYHNVKIRRKWMNATMRVDNWPVRSVAPREVKNTVFNSQSMIQIGGLMKDDFNFGAPAPSSAKFSRVKRGINIDRSFRGQMMGFFFNNVRVFSLAAHGSRQVTLIGDVELIGNPPINPDMDGMGSFFPTPPGGIPFPTTTMATTTTFTTSSTRTSRSTVKNASSGDECEGQVVCPGASGLPALESDPILLLATSSSLSLSFSSSVLPKPSDAPKNDDDWTTSSTNGLADDSNRTNTDITTSDGVRLAKTGVEFATATTARPPSTIGMIKDDEEERTFLSTPVSKINADKSKPKSLVPDDIILSNNTSSRNETSGNISDNLKVGGDGKTDSAFGGILTGTTAMIAGIVGAAVLCIVVLLVAIYKYKHKDESTYNVDERARNMNGRVPAANGKDSKPPIVRKKGGSLTVHGKTMNPRESDKEYYV